MKRITIINKIINNFFSISCTNKKNILYLK